MKPQAFDYIAPTSLDEAVGALTEFGDESKVLAGGQSLLPMMNFRLARPTALIDIGRIPGLRGVEVGPDHVTVGTLTTHRDMESSALPGPLGVLIRKAARLVGHYPIRVRGTFGGSIAHSDPASEWCQLVALLDATMIVYGPAGSREIAAQDFFVTMFTTTLEYNEVLTGVRVPLLGDDTRTNVIEFARRAGDFAIVSIMSSITVREGVVTDARLCAGGVADRTVRLANAEALLVGGPASADAFSSAAEVAAQEVNPQSDLHGDGDFRRDLVRALTRRSLVGDTP